MAGKNVVIFEDSAASNFSPLSLTRPVFELICGMTTIWKNIVDRFYSGADVRFICRDYLKAMLQQKLGAKVNDLSGLEDALFVNGRILAAFSQLPGIDGENEIGLHDGTIVYARLKAKEIQSLSGSISVTDGLAALNISQKEAQGIKLVNYLWQLISHNADAIKADFKIFGKPEYSRGIIEKGAYVRVKDSSGVKVYDAEEAAKLMMSGEIPLYVGEGSRVYPNVTIDLTGGPVYIGNHTDVRPPTLIDGPCCIMDSSGMPKQITIIDGALMRSGSTLGPVCRIGGELEESIIQGYTNKHHAGFIGHAYLGEWVNIGAMATNSDLKNDLSDVKVPVSGQFVDTGDLKVGAFIGDHAKLGIGALLTTGTVVGIMTNVLTSGSIPPQYIPSYCFYREDRFSKGFRPKTLIETAARVMSRRNVTQTQADVELLEKVYEMIKDERDKEVEQQNRMADNVILKVIRQWSKEQKS